MRRGKSGFFLYFSIIHVNILKSQKQQLLTPLLYNGTHCAFVTVVSLYTTNMTDIDFIRLSALVFATRLIGKTTDPVSEGTEMAERLFNKLKEKED